MVWVKFHIEHPRKAKHDKKSVDLLATGKNAHLRPVRLRLLSRRCLETDGLLGRTDLLILERLHKTLNKIDAAGVALRLYFFQ
jgi:hypothetical protein